MAIVMNSDILLSDDENDSFRTQRNVQDREDLFEKYSEDEFRRRFRLTKTAALHVLTEIEEQIEFPTDRNNAVIPINQLLLTLRYYATGSYCLTLADYARVSKATANRIIHRVSKALASLRKKYIYLPTTDVAIKEMVLQNYSVARFPKVIGMIDCTHIKIKSPGGNQAEHFRNRKGYFSLNVQMVGNKNLEIMDIVSRWPGSAHDSTIFNACHQKAMFEDQRYGDAVLLGDSGYPLYTYLLTPCRDPTTMAEILYNESHIRTRNCIERLFGVLKRRFPVLALGFSITLPNVFAVITATAVLHNILRMLNDPEPLDDPDLLLPLPWEELLQMGDIQPHPSHGRQEDGQHRRDVFLTEYFQRLTLS